MMRVMKVRMDEGSHPRKKSVFLRTLSKGGGSSPNPNFLRHFFFLVIFGHFSRGGDG